MEKDVQLLCAWTFAMTFIYRRRASGQNPSPPTKVLLLLLVLYGGLVRHNSGLVAAPVVLYVFQGRPWLTRAWTTVAAYVVIALSILAIGKALNTSLNVESTPVARGLLAFDLAGISTRVGTSQFPFPLSESEFDQITRCYDGATEDVFLWGDCRFLWPYVKASGLTDEPMLKAWMLAATRYPSKYVAHRLTFFQHFLTKRTNESIGYFLVSIFSRPVLYIIWLAGLIVLVIRAQWRPSSSRWSLAAFSFVLTEIIVSTLYLATYLPFGVAWGFRYVHTIVVGVTFATCVLVGDSRAP